MTAIAQLLGWALAATAAISAWWQFSHIRKAGTFSGVSLLTYSTWGTSWAAWAIISASEGLWAKAVTEAAGFLVDGAVAALIVTAMVRICLTSYARNIGAAIGISAAMIAGTWLLWTWVSIYAAVIFLTLFEILAVAPQVRAVRRGAATGVSVRAWTLSTLSAAGWVIYAAVLSDVLLAGWALVFAPASAYIAYTAKRKQRRWRESRAAHPSTAEYVQA